MNANPDRSHRLEILIGLLGTQLIVFALFFYILNEPKRIEVAQGEILAMQLDDAMTLYAENCSVCHGLAGEGIGATPALDDDALRTMPFDDLERVIADGRFGTSMPPWSLENGGPLSDYQIGEMVALVQSGDWQATQDRVVNLGLAPLVPFTADPDSALLEQVALLPNGAVLQTAIQAYAANCVACHGADGLGTSIAPALNDPLVAAKTSDDLTRIITFGNSGTLMAGWDGVLSAEDISAMVTLIQRWEEIPTGSIPAPDVPVPFTTESLALGGELYSANCARCHGPEGQGTMRAPALNVKAFLTDTTDQAVQQIVTLGVPGTSMPAWADRMTDADIQAIVGFIRQWEPTAPEIAIPARGGGGMAGQGGGPPWLRSSTQATAQAGVQTAATPSAGQTGAATRQPGAGAGTAQGNGAGSGNGQDGGSPWAQTETRQPASVWQTLDWRILVLVTGGLAVAFTLILIGYTALRKPVQKTKD